MGQIYLYIRIAKKQKSGVTKIWNSLKLIPFQNIINWYTINLVIYWEKDTFICNLGRMDKQKWSFWITYNLLHERQKIVLQLRINTRFMGTLKFSGKKKQDSPINETSACDRRQIHINIFLF